MSPAWYGVQLVKEGRNEGRNVTECHIPTPRAEEPEPEDYKNL